MKRRHRDVAMSRLSRQCVWIFLTVSVSLSNATPVQAVSTKFHAKHKHFPEYIPTGGMARANRSPLYLGHDGEAQEWKDALMHTVNKGNLRPVMDDDLVPGADGLPLFSPPSTGETNNHPLRQKQEKLSSDSQQSELQQAGPDEQRPRMWDRWLPQIDIGYSRWLSYSKQAFRNAVGGAVSTADTHQTVPKSGVHTPNNSLSLLKSAHVMTERPSRHGWKRLPDMRTIFIVFALLAMLCAVAGLIACLVACWLRGSFPFHGQWDQTMNGDFLHAREPDATPVSLLKRKTPRGIHHNLANQANSFWWSPLSALSTGRKERRVRHSAEAETPLFLSRTPRGSIKTSTAMSIV
eukprot:INCI9243.1.p1 GENE.INCI9243.1~~INCI9243.1.p1  ORF type:complete len:350 (-),score=36.14 INCI9243.1:208-1257(-)